MLSIQLGTFSPMYISTAVVASRGALQKWSPVVSSCSWLLVFDGLRLLDGHMLLHVAMVSSLLCSVVSHRDIAIHSFYFNTCMDYFQLHILKKNVAMNMSILVSIFYKHPFFFEACIAKCTCSDTVLRVF